MDYNNNGNNGNQTPNFTPTRPMNIMTTPQLSRQFSGNPTNSPRLGSSIPTQQQHFVNMGGHSPQQQPILIGTPKRGANQQYMLQPGSFRLNASGLASPTRSGLMESDTGNNNNNNINTNNGGSNRQHMQQQDYPYNPTSQPGSMRNSFNGGLPGLPGLPLGPSQHQQQQQQFHLSGAHTPQQQPQQHDLNVVPLFNPHGDMQNNTTSNGSAAPYFSSRMSINGSRQQHHSNINSTNNNNNNNNNYQHPPQQQLHIPQQHFSTMSMSSFNQPGFDQQYLEVSSNYDAPQVYAPPPHIPATPARERREEKKEEVIVTTNNPYIASMQQKEAKLKKARGEGGQVTFETAVIAPVQVNIQFEDPLLKSTTSQQAAMHSRKLMRTHYRSTGFCMLFIMLIFALLTPSLYFIGYRGYKDKLTAYTQTTCQIYTNQAVEIEYRTMCGTGNGFKHSLEIMHSGHVHTVCSGLAHTCYNATSHDEPPEDQEFRALSQNAQGNENNQADQQQEITLFDLTQQRNPFVLSTTFGEGPDNYSCQMCLRNNVHECQQLVSEEKDAYSHFKLNQNYPCWVYTYKDDEDDADGFKDGSMKERFFLTNPERLGGYPHTPNTWVFALIGAVCFALISTYYLVKGSGICDCLDPHKDPVATALGGKAENREKAGLSPTTKNNNNNNNNNAALLQPPNNTSNSSGPGGKYVAPTLVLNQKEQQVAAGGKKEDEKEKIQIDDAPAPFTRKKSSKRTKVQQLDALNVDEEAWSVNNTTGSLNGDVEKKNGKDEGVFSQKATATPNFGASNGQMQLQVSSSRSKAGTQSTQLSPKHSQQQPPSMMLWNEWFNVLKATQQLRPNKFIRNKRYSHCHSNYTTNSLNIYPQWVILLSLYFKKKTKRSKTHKTNQQTTTCHSRRNSFPYTPNNTIISTYRCNLPMWSLHPHL